MGQIRTKADEGPTAEQWGPSSSCRCARGGLVVLLALRARAADTGSMHPVSA